MKIAKEIWILIYYKRNVWIFRDQSQCLQKDISLKVDLLVIGQNASIKPAVSLLDILFADLIEWTVILIEVLR